MHVLLAPVPLSLLGAPPGDAETSGSVRARVERARTHQRRRYAQRGGGCNAEAPGRWLDANGGMSREGRAVLSRAANVLRLSARAYHRVIKVARTIADLADS